VDKAQAAGPKVSSDRISERMEILVETYNEFAKTIEAGDAKWIAEAFPGIKKDAAARERLSKRLTELERARELKLEEYTLVRRGEDGVANNSDHPVRVALADIRGEMERVQAAIQALGESVRFDLNLTILLETVRCYFETSDCYKELHEIKYTNDEKKGAITAFWLARLKPIMIMEQQPSKVLLVINELFALFVALNFIGVQYANVDSKTKLELIHGFRKGSLSVDALVLILRQIGNLHGGSVEKTA
jgi:hypothetical protein